MAVRPITSLPFGPVKERRSIEAVNDPISVVCRWANERNPICLTPDSSSSSLIGWLTRLMKSNHTSMLRSSNYGPRRPLVGHGAI
ncbi:hypothetical protein TNCT_337221 [Trichonephila clavata]|uniref:Uncharacterized protein n=1 Tax=Trichonephila clavata TaxID=2740835 RepID=A0A8X6KG50_TRICU|nr:hypothetical protein TNCT_337221 [Trichonephila clavata]